jgi:predicted RecB family endonuclease
MTIKNSQHLILDLLINLTVEQEALRNLIATEYVRHLHENEKDLNESLNELREVARKNLMAQIANKYGIDLGDIDSLINSAF